MGDFITNTKEATKGGFQAILKIRGLFELPTRVPSKFTNSDGSPGNDQIEVTLKDPVILEMEEGEAEPELKDGKFTWWMGYAKPGAKAAHKNTFYIRGFLTSIENAKETLPGLVGRYTTWERKDVDLGFKNKEGNPVSGRNFVYCAEQTADSPDIVAHIKTLVVGLNEAAVMRNLVMDARSKQFPEYKDALNAGTLAEKLGLKFVDGVFTE